MTLLKVFTIFAVIAAAAAQCNPTATTASGTKAPGQICAGQLIFEENFDWFNLQTWEHEINMAGGHNGEFQWYLNNRTNSYTENGVLYITPSFTEEILTPDGLKYAFMNINGGSPADQCTDAGNFGCQRQATPENIIPPIRSARIRTAESFSFKFGRAEIRAKVPAGDWLWPAVWMMPKLQAYGTWPNSGEIDIMESRGNREYRIQGGHLGVEQVGQTLHFGPYPSLNGFMATASHINNPAGYHNDFHLFQLEWTPSEIIFRVDGQTVNTIRGPFWDLGQFSSRAPGTANPWERSAYVYEMAPFDQEFYFTINLAVGGINFFPDEAQNPGGKPWTNDSPQAARDFWEGRNQWLPTWDLGSSRGSSLQVDYVKVWAL